MLFSFDILIFVGICFSNIISFSNLVSIYLITLLKKNHSCTRLQHSIGCNTFTNCIIIDLVFWRGATGGSKQQCYPPRTANDQNAHALLLFLLSFVNYSTAHCPSVAGTWSPGDWFGLPERLLSVSLLPLPSPGSAPSSEPSALCVLTCLARWSERMNRLWHVEHSKRFSPVCVRKCRWSSSERVKRFPQNSQLQTNGLSPVCQRRWAFRWDVLP